MMKLVIGVAIFISGFMLANYVHDDSADVQLVKRLEKKIDEVNINNLDIFQTEVAKMGIINDNMLGIMTQINQSKLLGKDIQGCNLGNATYDSNLTATGISMRPTIFTGNTLLVRPYKGEKLSEGCIISYKVGNELRTHRIKIVYDPYVVAEGDNNLDDEAVAYSQIRYVVVGVVFS